MRSIYQYLSLITIIALMGLNNLNAQLCSPNPMYTSSGVYPDTTENLATGCVGNPYQQDFTVVVPSDTVIFGFMCTVNYIVVDSVSGLPPGVLYSCNPASCNYPGGSTGCFQLYGTPLAAGTFNFTIHIRTQVYNAMFGTILLPYSYSGYEMSIGTDPILTTGFTSATCNLSNASAWVSASGSSGYTYSWNTLPPSTNDTVFNIMSGIYQVTVNDLYNCATSDTVIINDLGAPVIDTIIVNNVLCFGDSTGSATVVASGGTLPYEYLWVTGDTTATLSNVGNGTYSISVSDNNGCQVSSIASVSEPNQLLVFTSQNDVTCFGSNNGSAFATAIGGVGIYDYNWTSGSVAANAPALASGSYIVTVTDDNNCTATDSVYISEPPVLVTNVIGNGTTCFGGNDGTANVSISGGSPGYHVLWSNGDTTATATGLSEGTYYVTVTDTFGCNMADTIQISEPTQIIIGLTGTDESILGALDGSVNATVTGGTPGYSYLWSTSDTTEDISGLAGGTYVLEVTDLNGCSNSDTITIQTIPGFGIEPLSDLFTFYPNPVTDHFYIDIPASGTIRLLDIRGAELLVQTVNEGVQMIKLPNITQGVYILSVSINEKIRTTKLIVQ